MVKKKHLTIRDIAELFGVTERTIYRWRVTGRLPAPIQTSERTIRWRAEDIENLGIKKHAKPGGSS